MAKTVNIYLCLDNAPLCLLSIPLDDIKRLTCFPLKWLRFVTFAVCGAHGHLSELAGGLPVTDSSLAFDRLADIYYYVPQGDFHFIDYDALNDQVTSSNQTPHRSSFRGDVIRRCGPVCILTGRFGYFCDAAHIIPHSKGNEYIEKVIRDRSGLYEEDRLQVSGIDDAANGIFLREDLHTKFSVGNIVFLRTPNFALGLDDIPRVNDPGNDCTCDYRVTLQTLIPDPARGRLPDVDALLPATGTPPPAILLDYIYGVAIYKHWNGGTEIQGFMEKYFSEHYKPIPILRRSMSSDVDIESDDPRDGGFIPQGRKGVTHRSRKDGMIETMDEMNLLFMLLSGTTPEMLEARRRREEEEERETNRAKVQHWMDGSKII